MKKEFERFAKPKTETVAFTKSDSHASALKEHVPEYMKEIMEKEKKKSPAQKLKDEIKSISNYLDKFKHRYTSEDLTYYYKRLPKAKKELYDLEHPKSTNNLNFELVDDSDSEDEQIIVPAKKQAPTKVKDVVLDFDGDDEVFSDSDDEYCDGDIDITTF